MTNKIATANKKTIQNPFKSHKINTLNIITIKNNFIVDRLNLNEFFMIRALFQRHSIKSFGPVTLIYTCYAL